MKSKLKILFVALVALVVINPAHAVENWQELTWANVQSKADKPKAKEIAEFMRTTPYNKGGCVSYDGSIGDSSVESVARIVYMDGERDLEASALSSIVGRFRSNAPLEMIKADPETIAYAVLSACADKKTFAAIRKAP